MYGSWMPAFAGMTFRLSYPRRRASSALAACCFAGSVTGKCILDDIGMEANIGSQEPVQCGWQIHKSALGALRAEKNYKKTPYTGSRICTTEQSYPRRRMTRSRPKSLATIFRCLLQEGPMTLA